MQALLVFYRNFLWIANAISLFGCYLIVDSGTWASIIVVFWVKLVTNIFLGLYIHIFHPEQYVFFQHLGLDKVRLYAFTLLLDMAVWLVISILAVKIFL